MIPETHTESEEGVQSKTGYNANKVTAEMKISSLIHRHFFAYSARAIDRRIPRGPIRYKNLRFLYV